RKCGMKTGPARRPGADARVLVGIAAGIVGGIHLGALLRHLDRDGRRKAAIALVRPQRTGRPALDRTNTAAKERIDRPGRLVGFLQRRRGERVQRLPRQQVEPQHWLGKGPDAKERTRRQSGGNVAAAGGVDTGGKWAEAADRRQQPGAGEQAALEQLAAGDPPPGQLLDDLPTVVARGGGFPEPGARRVLSQKEPRHAQTSLPTAS